MTENRKLVEAQIKADWAAERFNAAYEKISTGLFPILRDSLKSAEIGHHDAEDIVSAAIQGFLKKASKDGPQSIVEPCSYLQTAVNHERVNHFRDRLIQPTVQAVEHDNRKIDDVATIPLWNKRAVFLVQAVSEIDEIAESDARRLVKAVLRQMRPIPKRILRNELKYGPREPIAISAARLRVKRGTYAVQKCRAFKSFSKLALATAKRLGIKWRGVTEEKQTIDVLPEGELEDDEPNGSAA